MKLRSRQRLDSFVEEWWVLYAQPNLERSTLIVYAGLRPGEALGLEWRDVRARTLVVGRAVTDGRVKGLIDRRRPRAVRLLAPLRHDLEAGRSVGPVVVRRDGGVWRETDWRNWRRRDLGGEGTGESRCGTY